LLHSLNTLGISIALSHDGRTLAATARSARLVVYNASNVNEPRFLHESVRGREIGWSADRNAVLMAVKADRGDSGYDDVMSWDLQDGVAWRAPEAYGAIPPVWSPDRRFLAVARPNEVQVIERGRRVAARSIDHAVSRLAWDPDENRLAIGGGNSVTIWDLRSDVLLGALTQDGNAVGALAWAPSDKLAVGFDDRSTIELWNPNTGQRIKSLAQGISESTSHLAFSPDGTLLAAARRWSDAAVCVWRVDESVVGWTFPTVASLVELTWPSRQTIHAVRDDGALMAFDVEQNGAALEPFGAESSPGASSASFSPDARLVAKTHRQSYICEAATGDLLAVVAPLRDGRIIQISPDGHYFASDDVRDEIVYAVELDSGERLTLRADEFAKRFRWRNDPRKARVAPGR
jgi:WD40 repeat protein